jgi:hypothetical protein
VNVPAPHELSPETARYFRDQFRSARAAALLDAEGFQGILFALERLGCFLTGAVSTLSKYQSAITQLANQSPLAKRVPKQCSTWHIPFSTLYEQVMIARNDALHQGAYARTLTINAVYLALVLEDALMNGSTAIHHFMVRDVTVAFPWQPVSFIRQTMLEKAFSYLPIHLESDGWHTISDFAIAQYLRAPYQHDEHRADRLAKMLDKVLEEEKLMLDSAVVCEPNSAIDTALEKSGGRPVLVTAPDAPDHLLGILTPFDLM